MKEEFQISDSVLNTFVNSTNFVENKKVINKLIRGKNYILINCSMVRMQIAWVVPKIIYAKGLASETGAQPVLITWHDNDAITKLCNSFGIVHLSYDSLCSKNIIALSKSVFKTIGFLIGNGSGEELKKLKLKNANIGLGIYEDIVRTSSLSTIRSCRNVTCIKKIIHILWMLYSIDALCHNRQIKYAVIDDYAYHENSLIMVLKQNNVKLYACSEKGEEEVLFQEDGLVERASMYMQRVIHGEIENVSDDVLKWTEKNLIERFEGENGRDIDRDAYRGKEVLSNQELRAKLGLKNKKNIVIMAHTFTDAVFNYGLTPFRDYYDWVEKTLEYASKNENVNWILKPHPSRGLYNESVDSIEMLYNKYKKDNIFFLSDSVSGESLIGIADVLVTIGGNAGAEYACFGIPAVIVGSPYYKGFGYTVEPKSIEEYKKCMENIEKIQPLNQEQVASAKKVFYLRYKMPNHTPFPYNDDFANLITNGYSEMTEQLTKQYFMGGEDSRKYNDKLLVAIQNFFANNKICDTNYYNRGKYRGSLLKD